VAAALRAADLRVETDLRNETVSRKVREAQLERVNYQVVVGGREAEQQTVSVRTRGNRQLGTLPLDQFIALCRQEIDERRITGE
jgi:threonyl-tRNA synthetase